MATVQQEVPPLVAGDYLSRDEFLRRWEAMPDIKRAELIDGVVYMPSPLLIEGGLFMASPVKAGHGDMDHHVSTWLGNYEAATPGCRGSSSATWLMGERSAPQPDDSMRILPEYGGQSRLEGEYLAGGPELLAEVSLSSTAYDLHQKLEVYERAGVIEYLAILLREQQVRWHRLIDGVFQLVPSPADGIYRSHVFPGLWLDSAALLAGNLTRVLAVLHEGLNSPEHKQFVDTLALAYRTKTQRDQ
jgi:Uma2 family endonuclease